MTLGVRLRDLRASALGRPVRQTELAGALDIRNSTVSTWESDAKLPSDERLQQIATFYATPRSLDPPRLLPDDELDEAELVRRDGLLDELILVRGGRADSPRNLWHFPDGAPIRIICGRNPAKDPPFSSGLDPNYMALSGYADQDALVELFGHLRAENPRTDVGFELAGRLESDDLQAHLVFLGNLSWVEERPVALFSLPIKQVLQAGLDGEVFETTADGRRYEPVLVEAVGKDGSPVSVVVEDVGFFWRAPSPMNRLRTLTICSGVFTRGVYGTVRMLTDRTLDDHNARYLERRFGGATEFGLLLRVPVHDHATSTPDLRDEKSRIREFDPPS